MSEALFNEVYVFIGGIKVCAERRAHAMRGAVSIEAKPFHCTVQAAIGHRSIGIETIWEEVSARFQLVSTGPSVADGP